METRLRSLQVNAKKSSFGEGPSDNLILGVSEKILGYYSHLGIYHKFGADNIRYISKLSTRYALFTLQSLQLNNLFECAESFGLWLSLVWITDGIFDSGGVPKTKGAHIRNNSGEIINEKEQTIAKLLEILNNKEILDTSQTKDNLFGLLIPTFKFIYKKYLDLMGIHVQSDNFKKLKLWTERYLETLCIHKKIENVDDYRSYRLRSGAIMCVVYHLMIYQELDYTNNDSVHNLFEHISVIVSYHNDILSFNRDLKDGTPNLVGVYGEKDKTDKLLSFKAAIKLTNDLYNLTISMIKDVPEEYATIALAVLEGSYRWTNQEDRYRVGLELLNDVLCNDGKDFDRILNDASPTSGEPKR